MGKKTQADVIVEFNGTDHVSGIVRRVTAETKALGKGADKTAKSFDKTAQSAGKISKGVSALREHWMAAGVAIAGATVALRGLYSAAMDGAQAIDVERQFLTTVADAQAKFAALRAGVRDTVDATMVQRILVDLRNAHMTISQLTDLGTTAAARALQTGETAAVVLDRLAKAIQQQSWGGLAELGFLAKTQEEALRGLATTAAEMGVSVDKSMQTAAHRVGTQWDDLVSDMQAGWTSMLDTTISATATWADRTMRIAAGVGGTVAAAQRQVDAEAARLRIAEASRAAREAAAARAAHPTFEALDEAALSDAARPQRPRRSTSARIVTISTRTASGAGSTMTQQGATARAPAWQADPRDAANDVVAGIQMAIDRGTEQADQWAEVMHRFTSSSEDMWQAIGDASGSRTALRVMQGFKAASLAILAVEAGVRAAYEYAAGFASSAIGAYGPAAQHFIAAAGFTAVAAGKAASAAGAIKSAASSGGGSAPASSMVQGGYSAQHTRREESPTPIQITITGPALDSPQFRAVVADAARQGARQGYTGEGV